MQLFFFLFIIIIIITLIFMIFVGKNCWLSSTTCWWRRYSWVYCFSFCWTIKTGWCISWYTREIKCTSWNVCSWKVAYLIFYIFFWFICYLFFIVVIKKSLENESLAQQKVQLQQWDQLLIVQELMNIFMYNNFNVFLSYIYFRIITHHNNIF